MKIRTGFVSNSSSQSFLISLFGDQGDQNALLDKAMRVVAESNEREDLKFPTVKEVTEAFLKAQVENYKIDDEIEDHSNKDEAFDRLSQAPNDVDYTVFRACNYDCEVYNEAFGRIVICTCNNESQAWDDALYELTEKYPHIKIDRWGEDLPERYYDDQPSNKYYKYSKATTKEEKKKLYLGTHWNYIKMEKDGKKIAVLEEPNEWDIKSAEEYA